MVLSIIAEKVPSSLPINSPIWAVAWVVMVRPPGFATSMVTYFTSRPPVRAISWEATAVTVPATCSPVSTRVSTAPMPGAMRAASPERKGTRIFMISSL